MPQVKPSTRGLLAALGMLAMMGLYAPGTALAQSAQQNLMGTCNKEAGDKKGDERKAFMKKCLADGRKQQNEKMKACNAEAKDKKGDARKAFMAECLKGDKKA